MGDNDFTMIRVLSKLCNLIEESNAYNLSAVKTAGVFSRPPADRNNIFNNDVDAHLSTESGKLASHFS